MKDLICARDVEALAQAGESVCRIACGTIITPSARDAAEALGVTFEEKSAPEAAAAAACGASQEMCIRDRCKDVQDEIISRTMLTHF